MMKAPAPTKTQGAFEKQSAKPKFSQKSTATEAQEQRIVALLLISPKTTDELRAAGCYQVSARIFGLRAKGYNIETELFDGWAADGLHHARMARYRLISLPEGGEQ